MTNPSTSTHDDSAMPVERLSTIPTELLDSYVALVRAVEDVAAYRYVRYGNVAVYDNMEFCLAAVQKAQSI